MEVETKLADTYCDLFQQTENQEHRAQLMEDIEKIVNSLEHFGKRITDRSVRADILEKADRLSEFLVRQAK